MFDLVFDRLKHIDRFKHIALPLKLWCGPLITYCFYCWKCCLSQILVELPKIYWQAKAHRLPHHSSSDCLVLELNTRFCWMCGNLRQFSDARCVTASPLGATPCLSRSADPLCRPRLIARVTALRKVVFFVLWFVDRKCIEYGEILTIFSRLH